MPTPSSLPVRLAACALSLAVATGGGAVVLAAPAAAAEGFAFSDRLGGSDRFSTAVAASRAAFPRGAGAVVLVNGYRVVDGLTASYVAGLHAAPVLYTEAGDLPAATAEEIARLGASEVHLVGGTAVVGAGVEEQLTAQGLAVTRYGGDDRYATAARVATAAGGSPEKVLVASGVKLSDALVVGPLAYARGYPVLLVEGETVPAATADALARLGVPTRIAVGGTTVVGPRAYEAVGADLRLDGPDRAGTAVAVAEHAVAEEGFGAASAGLVSGSDANTADALVATPLAGQRRFPLLFTAGEAVPAPTAGHLAALAPQLTGQGWVFGDTGAVPDAAAQAATRAAGG